MAKTKTATKNSATKKKATTKKAAPKKKVAKSKATKTGDQSVTVDRRRKPRRKKQEETAESTPPQAASTPPKLERRAKVSRRRQIDPTTCERDYSDSEVQFMNALDDYKRKSGRMFPTCSEVLEVIRGLGYVQLSPAELTSRNAQAADEQLDQQVEADAEEAMEESEGLRVMDEEFADA